MSSVFTNYKVGSDFCYFEKDTDQVVNAICNNSVDDCEITEEERASFHKIESYLRNNPPRGWEIEGPLNLLMTKEKMHTVLTETFAHMFKQGQCLRQSEFLKLQQEGKKFKKTDGQLSRIWGSNFANEQLAKYTEFKSAKHYLVIPDNQQTLNVNVINFYGDGPLVNSVSDQGVTVFSEFIEGEGVAPNYARSVFSDIGFSDFSAWGNIIEEKETLVKYAVDTEKKSFGWRVGEYFPNKKVLQKELGNKRIEETSGKLYSYLAMRWETLSQCPLEEKITFKIALL